jgi:UDP-glucose 4-epimerase
VPDISAATPCFALTDAGWPVTVIDNLVTGFRWAVPDDVPFYEGDIEDARCWRGSSPSRTSAR